MSESALEKLKRFEQAVEQLTFLDEEGIGLEADAFKRRLLALLRDKAIFEGSAKRPLLIVMAGGTNVGKSTLVNLIVGGSVCTVSSLARGTRSPVLCGDKECLSRIEDDGFLHGVSVEWSIREAGSSEPDVPTVFLSETDGFPPAECVIIDSPDMDSDHHGNRVWARRLLDACDALILVVTPEKYNDAVVLDFLGDAASTGRVLIAVFNKAEGDEAFNDFCETVWKSMAGSAPVVRIDRLRPRERGDLPATELRAVIERFTSQPMSVKIKVLDESIGELARSADKLAGLFMDEQKWLSELHSRIDASLNDVLKEYSVEISGQKFEELDLVFRRLLEDLRIPVLDDFYDGMKALGRTIWSRVGSLTGFTKGKESIRDERRAEEIERVMEACRAARSRLQRVFEKSLEKSKLTQTMLEQWTRAVPPPPEKAVVDAYLDDVEEAIQEWVREETAAIAMRLQGRPELRGFIVGTKATLQVGSGILGAVLTGGLDPTDLAVIPVIERLTAYLIERGIGYPYFLRCKSRLLQLRSSLLSRFLLSVIVDPVRAIVPAPDDDVVEILGRTIDSLPNAKELLHAG